MYDIDDRLPGYLEALAGLREPRGEVATDERFWETVRALYRVSTAVSNLENGYWGVMAEPIKAEYQRHTDFINHENSRWVRSSWLDTLEQVRGRVAGALGCSIDEIVLTRGATEAMLALIGGYNRLQPGDAVLYCDLDYPAMRAAMEWLRERRGVTPVCIAIPEPVTREGVLQAYRDALQRHPRVRLVLLTHLSHCTGLVMPVRELAAMAAEAGAEVICDAAHSWGQMDFEVGALGVPFAAFNLHKWIGAPVGCGALYIRRDRLDAIDPYFGDRDYPREDIRCRIHTGSPNFAAWLTIPAALQLHQAIGAARKEARLRHLRNAWVGPAREIEGLQILTPDDPTMVAGITAFRFKGRTAAHHNDALVEALRDRYGVFTVRRHGAAAGEVVRVTPAVYSTESDVQRLVRGLRELAAELRKPATARRETT